MDCHFPEDLLSCEQRTDMDSTSPENKPGPGGSGVFNTTHWSVVLAAGGEDSSEAQAALERLCKAYRYPLYVHVRRLGWRPEDAEDLTQQFLLRLIERKNLQRADPGRGRFRSFLLTSLKNFLADEWDKRRAQKRGASQPVLSWDGVDPEERYRLEPADALTPDQIYERRWAGSARRACAVRAFSAAGWRRRNRRPFRIRLPAARAASANTNCSAKSPAAAWGSSIARGRPTSIAWSPSR